jgi:hypothetical protein
MLSHAVMRVIQVFPFFVMLSLACVFVRKGLPSVEMWIDPSEIWCCGLSKVGMVEMVGLYSVLWHLVICEHFWPYVWNKWSWVMHTMSTWFWHKNRVWQESHLFRIIPGAFIITIINFFFTWVLFYNLLAFALLCSFESNVLFLWREDPLMA